MKSNRCATYIPATTKVILPPLSTNRSTSKLTTEVVSHLQTTNYSILYILALPQTKDAFTRICTCIANRGADEEVLNCLSFSACCACVVVPPHNHEDKMDINTKMIVVLC